MVAKCCCAWWSKGCRRAFAPLGLVVRPASWLPYCTPPNLRTVRAPCGSSARVPNRVFLFPATTFSYQASSQEASRGAVACAPLPKIVRRNGEVSRCWLPGVSTVVSDRTKPCILASLSSRLKSHEVMMRLRRGFVNLCGPIPLVSSGFSDYADSNAFLTISWILPRIFLISQMDR
jgi:hypothetical protein